MNNIHIEIIRKPLSEQPWYTYPVDNNINEICSLLKEHSTHPLANHPITCAVRRSIIRRTLNE
jgi:hypothetical protein